jgi:AraC-like DNA-binding protein
MSQRVVKSGHSCLDGTEVADIAFKSRLPTVTGFAVREAITALQQRGIPTASLLLRTGLPTSQSNSSGRRISASAQSTFLELASKALNDRAFGLHLAQRTNPRVAGLLFFVSSAAADIGEAITLIARYLRIINEAVRLKVSRTTEGARLEFDFFALRRHSAQQNAEFGIALLIKALRETANRKICPTRVLFAHYRRSDRRQFERFFGCPVEFGASSDQVFFSSEILAIPLATEDRYLLETLQPICDNAARERNTPKNTLRIAVENELQKLIPHGKGRKRDVANALMMTERTLARRLAEEGTKFEEVLDQFRRSLAIQYIKEREISLSQISWLLGYEGSSSFNHAFRRWTGASPSIGRNAIEPTGA